MDILMTGRKTFFIFLLGLAVLLPVAVLAIDFADGGAPFAPQGNAFVVTTLVNNIINNILNFIWVIFIGFAVIMFIWAGFLFLTAQGESDGVNQAKRALLWGIIGVAVGVLAFSLPWIIYGGLFGSSGNNNGGGGGGGGGDPIGACTFTNTTCSQMNQADCLELTGTWRSGACTVCLAAGRTCNISTQLPNQGCCAGLRCGTSGGSFSGTCQ